MGIFFKYEVHLVFPRRLVPMMPTLNFKVKFLSIQSRSNLAFICDQRARCHPEKRQ